MENRSVTNFREYLRIASVHPDIDYSDCVSFLKRFGKDVGLQTSVVGSAKKPVVILSWYGSDKNIGSILLNSHMDVVPVIKEKWIHDPFEAVKDEKGNIYARGSQDCKCIGIQYIEAIRKLKEEGFIPKRTVHVSFVPDEEIGGAEGMGTFVKSDEFKKLNIAFGLDEGTPFLENFFVVFNDERVSFPIKVICNGTTGHGSLLHPSTAGEKLWKVIDALMDFRETQVKELPKLPHPILSQGELTTVNLTMLQGGVQNNVVPPEISVTFDIRLSIHSDIEEFRQWLQEVCKNAGENVTLEVLQNNQKAPKTAVDHTNPFWMAFKNVLDEMNLKCRVIACPGATDANYLRQLGIPVLGFSPLRNVEFLLHRENEMLNEKDFLEGIDIYIKMIKALVNV